MCNAAAAALGATGTVDASHVLEVVKDEALVNKFVEYIQFFRSELHR
jgi:hypothetical protein